MLTGMDVAVAQTPLRNRPGEGDLDDVQRGNAEDLDILGTHAVQRRHHVLVDDLRVGRERVAGRVAHEQLHRDPERTGVLGPDLGREVAERVSHRYSRRNISVGEAVSTTWLRTNS